MLVLLMSLLSAISAGRAGGAGDAGGLTAMLYIVVMLHNKCMVRVSAGYAGKFVRLAGRKNKQQQRRLNGKNVHPIIHCGYDK